MATKKENAGGSEAGEMFQPGDILDLGALAAKIRVRKDPFSEFLYGRFRQEIRTMVQEFDGSKAASGQLATALAHEFNQIITDSAVYQPARFAHVELSHEARALAESKPLGRDLLRLNAMLIEEAYPAELLRNHTRTPLIPVERVQFNVRVEKRMMKVLKGLAEAADMSLSEMFEEIVLHAFDGRSTFDSAESRARIDALKNVYGMDYDIHAANRFAEGG